MTTAAPFPAHVKPFAFSWRARGLWLLLFIYLAYALGSLDFSWDRLAAGFGQGAKFFHRMWPPNFSHWGELLAGLVESLQMALLASFLGIAISLPLGLAAARNLMPALITWPVRALIIACRSFHPVIVAIIAVKAVGFGALAGIIALTLGSVGFVAKLFAEAIEEISVRQIEAVRATGASFANVVGFGVLPQVMFRFIGFCAYETDANLRGSTLVGLVGAGGIGSTLFTAFQAFEYDFVLAIVLAVIALVALGELLQRVVKRVFRQ